MLDAGCCDCDGIEIRYDAGGKGLRQLVSLDVRGRRAHVIHRSIA